MTEYSFKHCKTENIIPTIKEEDLDEEDEGVHDVREEMRRKGIKMEFTELKTLLYRKRS